MASRWYGHESGKGLPPQAPLVIGVIAAWGLALAAGKLTGRIVGLAARRLLKWEQLGE